MSDKLSPKPTNKRELLGWKYLNEVLQANLTIADKDKEPSATIDLSRYEMTFDEIKEEAERQGYTVKLLASGEHVTFT